MAEPLPSDLLSAAGVAALTALVVGIIKPTLLKLMGGSDEGWYVSVLYLVTFLIALGLSTLGAGLLGFTYENIVAQLLVAIVATTSAIGGYSIATGRQMRGR